MACCKWKSCRRVPKLIADDSRIIPCDNVGCTNSVHRTCLTSMLAAFDAGGEFKKGTCGKRCYNAILKALRLEAIPQPLKKRVPWHNDGPDAMWMTDGNNYHRYRGGDGQSGETKQTLASEVVECIAASGVKTARSPKDVMNKISGLETSFRVASDWLSNTGQRVENKSDLRAAILHRCPSFYELHPIMDDSPSTHLLVLNTDPGFTYSDNDSESSSSDSETDFPCSENTSQLTQGATERSSATSSEAVTCSTPSATSTRTNAVNSAPGSTNVQTANKYQAQSNIPCRSSSDGVVKGSTVGSAKRNRAEKISIQRDELQLRQLLSEKKSQEAKARIAEFNANTLKLQEEAEHWRIQRLVTLLRERAKLRAEGVPQAEIDAVLPIPASPTPSLAPPASTPTTGCDSPPLQHQ
ncbi:hypothetical protein GQ600_15220 [Phytophthora cactorum]|nr:hypothetical protein GQ600_15220 [Phytophthora cactorum]